MSKSCVTKSLSRTDVAESSTHQSGILIPVADGRRIFPEPFGDPEGELFDCRDHSGRVWQFKFHHRVKPSESRITLVTPYLRRYLIRSGDIVTICKPDKKGDPHAISFVPGDAGDGDPWLRGEEVFEAREEGAVQRVSVNRYERDSKNRRAAIEHHGVRCFGCRMEMAEVYGEIARGYIHIHHAKPISEMQGDQPDINDLVPLCPNCHAIVHLENPPISINRLKELIRQQRRGKTAE